MGMLIDGQWTDRAFDASATENYERKPSTFRHRIENGSPHPPEPGRYHLYISLACPWASRTNMVRTLKGLEDIVGMTIVNPDMLENGWTFEGRPDPVLGARNLYELYQAADPDFTGRVTVPVLWDKQLGTIVNNESGDIVAILNSAFEEWADPSVDLRPDGLVDEIDALNVALYNGYNNAVYRAGFARSQEAYDAAVAAVFSTLDEIEPRLADRRYLLGDRLTECDVRMFTTSVRFDIVYYSHFKCNVRHLWDYPNILGWMRDIYQHHGVARTVDLREIKRHYYGSQRWVNPSGIVPVGPTVSLSGPTGRISLGAPI